LESCQKALVYFAISILFPLILQSRISFGEVLLGRSADVSSRDLQVALDGHGTLSFGQQYDDQVAFAQPRIPRFLGPTRKCSTYLPGD